MTPDFICRVRIRQLTGRPNLLILVPQLLTAECLNSYPQIDKHHLLLNLYLPTPQLSRSYLTLQHSKMLSCTVRQKFADVSEVVGFSETQAKVIPSSRSSSP